MCSFVCVYSTHVVHFDVHVIAYKRVCACVHVCMHVCVHMCWCVLACAYVCACVCMCVCVISLIAVVLLELSLLYRPYCVIIVLSECCMIMLWTSFVGKVFGH